MMTRLSIQQKEDLQTLQDKLTAQMEMMTDFPVTFCAFLEVHRENPGMTKWAGEDGFWSFVRDVGVYPGDRKGKTWH